MRRSLALHLRWVNEDVHRLMPAAKNVQDVLQGSAARRSDQTDAAGKSGDGLLASLVEEPLGCQLGLQLLEGNLQRAGALGLQMLGLKLQVAALVVDGHPAARDDLQTVLGTETQQPRLSAPHHHSQLG